MLIANAILKNPADKQGSTPLHYAVINGNLEMCELIIGHIQDKNPANDRGKTPLDHAKSLGYPEIYQFIVQNVEGKNTEDMGLFEMSEK